MVQDDISQPGKAVLLPLSKTSQTGYCESIRTKTLPPSKIPHRDIRRAGSSKHRRSERIGPQELVPSDEEIWGS